jgi:CheY-like chemotaxis protein
MTSPLHILHVEDDPNDAALVQSTLEAGGITCAIKCVHRRDEFVAALERGGIDLILSDYSMPAFDGTSALKIAQAKCPAIPLIFVSGTLGEERAIDSLKNGATDYVLKERLARLVPAVQRAMQEAKERLGRQQAEAKRREYSSKLEVLSRRLDPETETQCFRIAQEAINNVVKHANARIVTVEVSRKDEQLHLSVRDDGVGFDVAGFREQAMRGISLGLLSMEERATLAGGSLQYHSVPGKGTEVHAWFPLKWADSSASLT